MFRRVCPHQFSRKISPRLRYFSQKLGLIVVLQMLTLGHQEQKSAVHSEEKRILAADGNRVLTHGRPI